MKDSSLENLLLKGAEEFGLILSKVQIDRFFIYMDLLKIWNKKINLTSIEEDNDVIIKHFIDSLSIIPFIKNAKFDLKNHIKNHINKDISKDISKNINGDIISDINANLNSIGDNNCRLIDIGTGAGFPGIPLKIVYDELDVTLLDSTSKKVEFLKECINCLKLDKINAFHGRAEDCGNNPEFREKYDISTARAVASMPVLLEYCLPFVKKGGIFIAMKGKSTGAGSSEIDDSKKALDILGGKIEVIKEINLPHTDNKRNIIIVKKFRQTPTKYPRKAGKPSKLPLI